MHRSLPGKFKLLIFCLLVGACTDNSTPITQPNSPISLPPTWTAYPTEANTATPTALWSPQPSHTHTTTPEWLEEQQVLQGDVALDQWLVMVEDARAISLQTLPDGSYLMYGKNQTGAYKEEPFLLRFGPRGELIWQKSLIGMDPVKVIVMPVGGILALERESYSVFDFDGKLIRASEVVIGEGRDKPLGFGNLQPNISYLNNEIAVMDRSGVVSFFNPAGDLIRQQYSDIAGKYQDWYHWYLPNKVYVFRVHDIYSYGFQYREFEYEPGPYSENVSAMDGNEKLKDLVLPPDPVYLVTGYGSKRPIILTAVEGEAPGIYNIWLANLHISDNEPIFPGNATQRDFSYIYLDNNSYVLGSTVRLYSPIDGTFLRMVIPRYTGDETPDLLFGDGEREGMLIGGADQPDGQLLLVGNLEKEGRWGSDLFFLKLNPFDMLSGCPWIRPSAFGSPQTGESGRSSRGGRREESNLMTLDFLVEELEDPGVIIEDLSLEFLVYCSSVAPEPSSTPVPPPSATPYSGPTWTPTWTPTPTPTPEVNN